jgi:hypothetical protein
LSGIIELATASSGKEVPVSRFLSGIFIILLAAVIPAARSEAASEPAFLYYDSSVPQLHFAASEIRAAYTGAGGSLAEGSLEAAGSATGSMRLVLAAGPEQAGRMASLLGVAPLGNQDPQAYAVRRRTEAGRNLIVVLGADPVGAMYGGLDVAEAIRLDALATLRDSEQAPNIARRGIKFNIPLDARTPSYSDNSDSAQQNIPEMWSFDFWEAFLDNMARHRYNVLTLWNLHPFPSLVKVPEFPEVALDDVKRATIAMDETFSHTGHDMVRPEMLENLETIKEMSIEDKIRFWRRVMQHAHDRGIETYLFTWNIFTWGAQGKHGITPDQDNPRTIEYFRASVRETLLTYPLLAGFGITAGEQMRDRKDEYSKEKWLWNTYGKGILDAKELQPGRHIRLIHRFHQTALDEILNEWNDYPDTFDLSFKYAIAHMYSVPNPPYIKDALPHLSAGRRTWLTVRNDDIYSFRWGDPEFARAFIRHMPGPDKVAGFYMGPDGYVWGREFLSTEPQTPRELVIEKQWYSFMLWGRLAYNPDLPDDLFRQTLAQRFPQVPAEKLMAAWSEASKVFPQITRFHWGDIDLRWYPEANLSHPRHRGFFTVRHFIEGQTMPESGILNILEWRAGQESAAVSPLQVADALAGHAARTLEALPELRKAAKAPDRELRLTLGDLEAMAHLGNYYAAKIRGAAELAMFDKLGQAEQQRAAVEHLEAALDHWKRYAAAYSRQYKPQLLNRVGFVDIPGFTRNVEEDIAIAKNWQPGTIPDKAQGYSPDRPFRR